MAVHLLLPVIARTIPCMQTLNGKCTRSYGRVVSIVQFVIFLWTPKLLLLILTTKFFHQLFEQVQCTRNHYKGTHWEIWVLCSKDIIRGRGRACKVWFNNNTTSLHANQTHPSPCDILHNCIRCHVTTCSHPCIYRLLFAPCPLDSSLLHS